MLRTTASIATTAIALSLTTPAAADYFDPSEGGYVDRETLERAFGRAGFEFEEDAGDVDITWRFIARGWVYCSNEGTYPVQYSEEFEVDSYPDEFGLVLDDAGAFIGAKGGFPEEGDPCPGRRARGATVTGVEGGGLESELTATWNGLKHGLDDGGGLQEV